MQGELSIFAYLVEPCLAAGQKASVVAGMGGGATFIYAELPQRSAAEPTSGGRGLLRFRTMRHLRLDWETDPMDSLGLYRGDVRRLDRLRVHHRRANPGDGVSCPVHARLVLFSAQGCPLAFSANAYDYANQDPVDAFDLDGEKLCRHRSELSNAEVCANTARGLKKRTEHVVRVANRIEQKYHNWGHSHPLARKPTEKDGWTPCKVTGVTLSGLSSILSTIGVGLDATGIGAPAGGPLTLVGGTSDLAGVGADEAHDAGWC